MMEREAEGIPASCLEIEADTAGWEQELPDLSGDEHLFPGLPAVPTYAWLLSLVSLIPLGPLELGWLVHGKAVGRHPA